jgi:predicted nucleic acid-binding protein
VLRLLENDFPFSVFLGEAEVGDLGRELGRLRITGGSVYDGLVGAAARHHRVPLLSRDGRARPTYEALGVELEPFAN